MSQKIMDSDRHVVEPMSLWENYVDSAVRKKYPVTLKKDSLEEANARVKRTGNITDAIELPPMFMFRGKPLMNNWGEDLQISAAYNNAGSTYVRNSAMSSEGQIKSMDSSGIHCASIFPTFTGYVVNHQDVPDEVSLAYADGYNHWLKDYCSPAPDRLNAVGMVSLSNPKTLVKQLERIRSFGWQCITVRPEVINGRTLGHQDYEPFWEACEHHNIAVALHGGTHLWGTTVGSDRFSSRFALHACSHPMEMQMAFVSLLESGVLERHPKLKIAFIESGASWIPHWLWRLDNICYDEYPQLIAKNIKMRPSEYFKRQCWVTVEVGEPSLREAADIIGHDKLLYGSDFPHTDHLQFSLDNLSEELSDFSSEELSNILADNPRDFYLNPARGDSDKKSSKDSNSKAPSHQSSEAE